MSAFEFVLVSFAIIVGFGVSEILSGWAEQIRVRHRVSAFRLQIAASALILLFQLQYLWGLWLSRGIEWSFPVFLLLVTPAVLLALCGHVMRVDTRPEAEPGRTQYFRSSRPTFGLLALVPLTVIVASFATGVRDRLPDAPSLPMVTAVRLGLCALFLWLAFSTRERHHWLGLGAILLILLGVVMRLVFRLGDSAPA